MPYSIKKTTKGFVVEEDGQDVSGTFPTHFQANDWIQQRGRDRELQERELVEKDRAVRLSGPEFKKALRAEIANPSPAPRGRPVADDSCESALAFDYYWRIRKGGKAGKGESPTRVVDELARQYRCTSDHVRKIRKEYTPVGKYDDDLLDQLRAQTAGRLARTPVRSARPSRVSQLDQAEHLLRSLLKDGQQILVSEVIARARLAGLTERTTTRAKDSLAIVSVRVGRAWAWKLPQGCQKD